jgi:hypothetical protein
MISYCATYSQQVVKMCLRKQKQDSEVSRLYIMLKCLRGYKHWCLALEPNRITSEFYQIFKEDLIQTFLRLFHE